MDELSALAQNLREQTPRPVQIVSYWTGVESTGSEAKLASLKRGMTVRSFLRDRGIASARLELKRVAEEFSPADLIDIRAAGQ